MSQGLDVDRSIRPQVNLHPDFWPPNNWPLDGKCKGLGQDQGLGSGGQMSGGELPQNRSKWCLPNYPLPILPPSGLVRVSHPVDIELVLGGKMGRGELGINRSKLSKIDQESVLIVSFPIFGQPLFLQIWHATGNQRKIKAFSIQFSWQRLFEKEVYMGLTIFRNSELQKLRDLQLPPSVYCLWLKFIYYMPGRFQPGCVDFGFSRQCTPYLRQKSGLQSHSTI